MRRKSRRVMCGGLPIGDGAPVSIQSMTNTDTRDIEATLKQIRQLEEAGCQIVRVSVPDREAAEAFREIRKKTDIPLVADIHFDYRLAVEAIRAGADKVRINPGNIGGEDGVRAVTDAARKRRIPVRIGVNSGSIEKDILKKYGGPCAEGLVESALRNTELVEKMGLEDIVLSVKSSDVVMNYRAYLLLAERIDYPLHIGVTESGTPSTGIIKSSVGLGALLLAGIGDTIRVSLTADPVREIPVAREILKNTGNFDGGIDFVSCPTCSRCRTDLTAIADEITFRLGGIENEMLKKGMPKVKVAVMGCAVNGPGEASDADFGIACGDGKGVFFRNGHVEGTVDEADMADRIVSEVRRLAEKYAVCPKREEAERYRQEGEEEE